MKKKNTVMKKTLIPVVTAAMLAGMMPVSAFAADKATETPLKLEISEDGDNLVVAVVAESEYVNGATEGWLSWDNEKLEMSSLKSIKSDLTINGEAADLAVNNEEDGSYTDGYFAIYANDLENGDTIAAGSEIVEYVFEDVPYGVYNFELELRDVVDIDGEKLSWSGQTVTQDYTKEAEPAKITKQPTNYKCSIGDQASFTVEAEGSDLTYQWYYKTSSSTKWKKTSVKGYATPTISMAVTEDRATNLYRCQITGADGNTVISDAVGFTIDKLTIKDQTGDQTAYKGQTVSFSVTVSAADPSKVTYQWYYKAQGSSSWKKTSVKGNKTNTISMDATDARNGNSYRCVVADGDGNKGTSEAATLTVVENPLVITAQPQSVSADAGNKVSFTVQAESSVQGDLAYLWYYKAAGTSKWKKTSVKGYKTSTITMDATSNRNGNSYRCVITDADGNTVTSDEVTLTLNS